MECGGCGSCLKMRTGSSRRRGKRPQGGPQRGPRATQGGMGVMESQDSEVAPPDSGALTPSVQEQEQLLGEDLDIGVLAQGGHDDVLVGG